MHSKNLMLCVLAVAALVASTCAGEQTLPDDGWVTIIGADGPTGIRPTTRKNAKQVTPCSNVKLPDGAKELTAVPGKSVIAVLSKSQSVGMPNLYSEQAFGDCEVQLEFVIGPGSNSGVKLQEKYEIQLYDSHGKEKLSGKDCGGVYPRYRRIAGLYSKYIDDGVPAAVNAAKPAGEWQSLRIVFRAPRFDDAGLKTQNAMFVSVVLNGKQVHSEVELVSPTGNISTPLPEVASAPLMLQVNHGAVAFRNVRVKPLEL